jgi:sigma-B regulation protein RsbU (phosphoserine phosphatase)
MVLGVAPKGAYESQSTAFAPGDTLLLFSDGVTEAASPGGGEFGEERLAALLTSLRGQTAADAARAIHDAVSAFAAGAAPADDITVVVIRRCA